MRYESDYERHERLYGKRRGFPPVACPDPKYHDRKRMKRAGKPPYGLGRPSKSTKDKDT